MAGSAFTELAAARRHAAQAPVDLLDVSHFSLFEHDTVGPYFERLRKDDPVHYCASSPAGPYWSITRYEDVRSIEIDHETYSSERDITIVDQRDDFQIPMFIAMDPPEHGRQRRSELMECLAVFEALWEEKRTAEPSSDLVSMLAHAPATEDMRARPMELLGNIILLIIGGNDTTRNSISGGVLALHEHPGEWRRLRRDLSLVTNMVSEIIRRQTPLAHMRRSATRDTELGGKRL